MRRLWVEPCAIEALTMKEPGSTAKREWRWPIAACPSSIFPKAVASRCIRAADALR